MGWQEGRGLGARGDGMLTHVTVAKKDNQLGIGADKRTADNWLENANAFTELLQQLNQDPQLSAVVSPTIDVVDKLEFSTPKPSTNKAFGRMYHRTKFMKAKQRAVENQQDLVDILGVKQTSEASSETPTVQVTEETREELKVRCEEDEWNSTVETTKRSLTWSLSSFVKGGRLEGTDEGIPLKEDLPDGISKEGQVQDDISSQEQKRLKKEKKQKKKEKSSLKEEKEKGKESENQAERKKKEKTSKEEKKKGKGGNRKEKKKGKVSENQEEEKDKKLKEQEDDTKNDPDANNERKEKLKLKISKKSNVDDVTDVKDKKKSQKRSRPDDENITRLKKSKTAAKK